MNQKTRIAVLGGGLSSLSTVFHLTNDPSWADKYEITLYQLGWRLGGKCASSRNDQVAMRIEEHGLHLWFGFYDNAFAMMKECFNEYANPLATLDTAFSGYDHIALQEQIRDTWETWMNFIPPNDFKIGDKAPELAIGITNILDFVNQLFDFQEQQYKRTHPTLSEELQNKLSSNWQKLAQLAEENNAPDLAALFQKKANNNSEDSPLINLFIQMARDITKDIKQQSEQSDVLLELLDFARTIIWDILKLLIDNDFSLRRLWITVDFFLITLKGFIVDDVIFKGFSVINSFDLREWLTKNGAMEMTVNSAIVQAIYGLVFGGKGQYTFEAGTAMEGFMKMALLYKGHIYYRMNEGMGDIIIGPIYNVLKSRGVKFEFFKKVTRIVPSVDGTSIDEIHMDVQATLKPGIGGYEPMIYPTDGQMLPYWPEHPRYEFLEQGEALKHGVPPYYRPVNLESYYSDWQAVGQQVLTFHQDFDVVIQGISIGALPYIAEDILKRPEREDWRLMVTNIKPVPTIAAQLWLLSTIQQMGWKYAKDGLALLGSYQEPYDTWSEMNQLIDKERWPANQYPQDLAYLVGPTPTEFATMAPFSDHDFPARQYEVAKRFTKEYLQNLAVNIWPGTIDNNHEFKWEILADLNNERGENRLDSQYFRANIDPSELYVLSEMDTSKYRLKTDKSGFDNMLITGDWIDIGFNAGCVECAVTAGMLTATALDKKYSTADTEVETLAK